MEILSPGATILTVTENGYGKRTPLEDYRVQNRGGQGIITIRTSERNGTGGRRAPGGRRRRGHADHRRRQGAALRASSGISTMGRATQGVRLMDLADDEKIVSVAQLADARTPPTCARPCRARRRDEELAPGEGASTPARSTTAREPATSPRGVAVRSARSTALLRRARRRIPGGVNTPVRAFGAVGGTPPFAASGRARTSPTTTATATSTTSARGAR